MKISEVTRDIVKNYCHVHHAQDDALIEAILIGAKGFVQSYSGLTLESMDLHEDMSIALLVLCAEMYDNRSYSVDNHSINPVVKTILQMHSINNL
jgi:uncharacterized phage protein (predicted DNA packaging)